MKRMIASMVCISVLATVTCGCSLFRNDERSEPDPSIETSIVYVYVDSDDQRLADEATPPTANPTVESSMVTFPIEDSEETIIDNAIAAAEEALSQRDFDTANDIIVEASGSVSDNSRLVTEQSRINSLRPVSLLNLNLMGGGPSICGRDTISTGETVEAIGFTIEDIMAGETLRTTTGLTFATYGEYDTFACRLALMNDSSKNSPLDHFIEVYADGLLIYTSPTITAGSMPLDIEVDISGADSIEIKFGVTNNTGDDWYGSMWSWDFYAISFCIADPVFYPAYTPLDGN